MTATAATKTGRRIFLLENGQYVYDNGMPVDIRSRPLADDKSQASINILNLGRELEAMEQRRNLQEQKDKALEDMRRQADRARSRAKKSWEDDIQAKAIQAQREAREVRKPPAPEKKKASVAPLAPAGKFNRKIDWKE